MGGTLPSVSMHSPIPLTGANCTCIGSVVVSLSLSLSLSESLSSPWGAASSASRVAPSLLGAKISILSDDLDSLYFDGVGAMLQLKRLRGVTLMGTISWSSTAPSSSRSKTASSLSEVAPSLLEATSSLSEAETPKSAGVHDTLSGDGTRGSALRKKLRVRVLGRDIMIHSAIFQDSFCFGAVCIEDVGVIFPLILVDWRLLGLA